MKKLVMVGIIAATACGCIVIKNDGGYSDISPSLVKDKVAERYSVSTDMVAAQDHINCLFGFICWGSTATHIVNLSDAGRGGVGRAKNGAYANACDAAKCDAIVGTHYTITIDNYILYRRIKAEVKGFPVNMIGVDVIPADKDTPVENKRGGIF